MTKPSLGIIGPGTVGTALGRLAFEAGYLDLAIGGRDAAHAEGAARAVGRGVLAMSAADAAARSQWLILAVRDGEIEALARELADRGCVRAGASVLHCSGARSSLALEALRAVEAVGLASLHPLQTFPDVEGAVAKLPGSHAFAEGDARGLETCRVLAPDIGMRLSEIDTEAKPLYHASAVLACNDFTALMDAALESFEATGIDRETAWQALSPLVHATLANIDRLGPQAALTGPVRRGDPETLSLHVEAVEAAKPEVAPVYRALGRWTVGLARRAGFIEEAMAQRLHAALRDAPARD